MFGLECRTLEGHIDELTKSIGYVVYSDQVDFKTTSIKIDPRFLQGGGKLVPFVSQSTFVPVRGMKNYLSVRNLRIAGDTLIWEYGGRHILQASWTIPVITVFKVINK
ncbi:hypothetical protein [Xenorhabdus hominickii]|uniref:Uncharacterized protein n=1 Tax=Xenorhabdus hominickii TaxID=351679 RepID=A0A1V0M477_XENHO|nr:hypothetical protein [Xenorhabdus hominickii]ARD69673.1 hypothetical protein [Xenorhabdus hominickii]PHM52387.1 hypothetical protein Xhom_04465 [Xenorhabdus hominickii]